VKGKQNVCVLRRRHRACRCLGGAATFGARYSPALGREVDLKWCSLQNRSCSLVSVDRGESEMALGCKNELAWLSVCMGKIFCCKRRPPLSATGAQYRRLLVSVFRQELWWLAEAVWAAAC